MQKRCYKSSCRSHSQHPHSANDNFLTNGNLNLFLLRREMRVAFTSHRGETLLNQHNSPRATYIPLEKQHTGRAQVSSTRSRMSHGINISPRQCSCQSAEPQQLQHTGAFTDSQPSTDPSECSGLTSAAKHEGSRCQVIEEEAKEHRKDKAVS